MGDTATAVLECDTALTELQAARAAPGGHRGPAAPADGQGVPALPSGALRGAVRDRRGDAAGRRGAGTRPKPLEWAHNVLALAAMGRGQVDEALDHFEQFRDAAARSNDHLDLAMAHSNLGIQHQYAGDFAQARAELERAVELCREAAAEHRAINTMQRLGWVFLGEGNLDAALRQGEYACALASRAADRWAADCHDLLGAIAVLQADWSRAIDCVRGGAAAARAWAARRRAGRDAGRPRPGAPAVRRLDGRTRPLRGGARHRERDRSEPVAGLGPAPPRPAALVPRRPDRRGPVRAALDLAETMPRSIEYGPTLIVAVETGRWRDEPGRCHRRAGAGARGRPGRRAPDRGALLARRRPARRRGSGCRASADRRGARARHDARGAPDILAGGLDDAGWSPPPTGIAGPPLTPSSRR